MGGYSSEVDISLKSGNVVYNHLDRHEIQSVSSSYFKNNGWTALDVNNTEYPIDKNDFSFVTKWQPYCL